jgi:lactoylglutathione lyase
MASWLGQYCICVADLARSEHFYSQILGLEVQQHVEIPEAREAVLGAPGKDAKIQLAQKTAQDGPIDHGNALWKLYVYTDDIAAVYATAMEYGSESVMAPTRLEKWPVTAAFVRDPDGYLVQLMQRHA